MLFLFFSFAIATIPDSVLNALNNQIDGDVVLPSNSNFQSSTKQWNARFDSKQPRAFIFCENENDVVQTVRTLRKYDTCTTIRSAGHSFPGWAVIDGCIVIDVSRMNKMAFSKETNTISIGPGTNFWDFTHYIADFNITTTHGFGPTVGFGGYTQGGGVGLTHRKFGLAVDNLVRAEIVLQSGEIINCTESNNGDLFWALRGGGGGSFGVVTGYEFKTYDASSQVLYVMLEWKFSKSIVRETAEIWQQYMNNPSVSRDFGLYWRIDGNPITGELGTKVQIYGIWTGELDTGKSTIQSFVKLFPKSPKVTTTPMMIDKAYEKFMGPYRHTPHTGFFLQSKLLQKPISGASYDILAKQLDKLHFLETFALIWLDPLGGKVAEVKPADTAFYWRNSFANFAIFVFYLTPQGEAPAKAWMDETFEKLAIADESVYVNFNFANLSNWQHQYYGENYERLQHVKSIVDAGNYWRFPQSVEPTEELSTLGGSGACIAKNCLMQGKDCFLDSKCRQTLFCLAKCGMNNQTCTYGCELDHADTAFDTMFTCMIDHECIPHYPPDPFSPPTSLETGVTMEQMVGNKIWWIVRGFSPAYDKFPCQHLYFNQSTTGWIYTADFEYEPNHYAMLHANISTDGNGLFLLEYTEHGLHHDESWYLIATTSEEKHGYESRVFRYGGKTPIMDYDGGIWFQYSKDYNASITKEAFSYISKRLAANSIDINTWTYTDNSGCTN